MHPPFAKKIFENQAFVKPTTPQTAFAQLASEGRGFSPAKKMPFVELPFARLFRASLRQLQAQPIRPRALREPAHPASVALQ
jgi:hypothetical protein